MFLVTLVLLGSLVFTLDFKLLGEVFANINIGWLLLSLVPVVTEISFKSIRQKILTDALAHLTLRNSFTITLVGFIFGAITPGRVGDLVKVHLLAKKSKLPLSQGFALGVIEKIIDLLSLFMLAATGILIFVLGNTANSALLYLLGFVFAASAAMLVFLNKKIVHMLLDILGATILPKRYVEKIEGGIKNFYAALALLWKKKRALGWFTAFAFALWVSRMTQVYLFILALGLQIDILYFIILMPMVFVAEILPIAIMGLGVREYTLILLLSLVGISAEASVALGMLIFTLGILPTAIIGYIVTVREYGGIKAVKL